MTAALVLFGYAALFGLAAFLWWRMDVARTACAEFEARFGYLDDIVPPRVRLNRPRRSADR